METYLNKQTKYKNLTDNLCVALSFYVLSILLDLSCNLFIFGTIPSFFNISLGIIHVLSLTLFLLPTKTLRRVFATIFFGFQFVITISNDILYGITGEIFTFEKLALAGEAVSTFSLSMLNFWHILTYVLILGAFVFCTFFMQRFFKTWKANRKQVFSIITIFALSFVLVSGFGLWKFSDKRDLLINEVPSTYAFQTFGFYGFYSVNAVNTISNLNPEKELDEQSFLEIKNYVETNKTMAKNEFSGISKNNNLVMILAESVDFLMIDEFFTPNLFHLLSDGLYLKNYYTENKTNMSEGLALFGTYGLKMPLNAQPTLKDIFANISIPTLLKQKDNSISCNYFHSFKSTFYRRDQTFCDVGFDSLTFADQIEEDLKEFNKQNNNDYDWTAQTFENYVKDSNFFDYLDDQMILNNQRFFTAYAAMTTHGSYFERGSNSEYLSILNDPQNSDKLEKIVQDIKANGGTIDDIMQEFLCYKASLMDFDKMIGKLFQKLKDNNQLDSTTVVIYPDHNSFYNNMSWKIRGKMPSATNLELSAYNMGAIVYDTKLCNAYKQKYGTNVVDKFCSICDVYPTVCDIFDLDFNQNLCYGKSILSNEKSLAMSLKDHHAIFNQNYYYFNEQLFDAFSQEIVTNYEFEKELNKLLKKFEIHERLFKFKNSFLKLLN